MSAEMPVALVEAPDAASRRKPASSAWIETAFTVLFTATAVLFASLVAVMTGMSNRQLLARAGSLCSCLATQLRGHSMALRLIIGNKNLFVLVVPAVAGDESRRHRI